MKPEKTDMKANGTGYESTGSGRDGKGCRRGQLEVCLLRLLEMGKPAVKED